MVVLGLCGAAVARDDGGSASFFRQESERQAPAAAPEPAAAPTFAPLTIKRGPSRSAFRTRAGSGAPRLASVSAHAVPAGPQPKISIFQDRTLRRGDVVMLKQGLRVFAGSRQFPYTADDFVALEQASGINKQTRTALSEIARNQEPH